MADERILPELDKVTADAPVPRVPSENGVQPASTPAVAPPKVPVAEWMKYEIVHLVAAFVLGLVVFLVFHFGMKQEPRVALIAGAITVVFGRGLTRHVLPERHVDARAVVQAHAQPTDTFREIVETVVFVVVLVLLLKSFVAEAFVIPTGSMAQTLWGYQKVIYCPECGYTFPVNCSSEVDPQDNQPHAVRGCTCPNCRYHIDFRREASINPNWTDPGWNSGDRVLVAKFLYDLLGKMPDRLDVVVFKYPGDNSFPSTGPYKNHVQINYIKRLVGKPGEIVAIHEGNLYYIPADQVPEEERKKFEADPEEARRESSPPQFWQSKYTHAKTDQEARDFFEKYRNLFQIIRKPPDTMLAMRRIVYDNDHPAKDLPENRWARWTGNDAWSATGRDFGHAARAADKPDWLRYRHRLRTTDGKPQLITDFMGYNTWEGGFHGSPPPENWVGDLMVECDATVEKSEGTLTLELSKGVDRFQARFNLATGECKLLRLADGRETELASRPTDVKKAGTYRLRFADFDQRLTVWVDNALPFGDGVTFSAPAVSGPREENDLEPASIGVQGGGVRVGHLQVWRDTYYTTAQHDAPHAADVSGVDFTDPRSWKPLSEMPVRTIGIQPGHFLCLGDNSPESSDGRAWGLVPERLLLGRALLVYYPFGRAGRIR